MTKDAMNSFVWPRHFRRAALLVALLTAAPSYAQLTRGIISGTVRDASGAVVPGAAVTLTNEATNQKRTATSDGKGFYRVPALEPGTYTIVVELSGFSRVEERGIEVKPSQEASVGVQLRPGGASETVTVVGDIGQIELNKTNATIGTTTPGRVVQELPTGTTRNVNGGAIALLGPNAFAGPGSTGLAYNGNRARNDNFMIDGSDNNDTSVTLATVPVIPEAVAELQVLTSPYNAEFGRNSGGQLNIITRSGSNRYRGEAFEYHRDSRFNARTNVEKRNGLAKAAEFHRDQFGGDISGPIIKDKTFFFALFQQNDLRSPATPGSNLTMPTATGFAALSSVPLRAGQSQSSRQAVLGGIAYLNDIYKLNPVFTNVRTTLVNGVPIEIGATNLPIAQPSDASYAILRVDHEFSPDDRLTARYIFNKQLDTNVTSNTQFGTLFAAQQDVRDHNLSLSETHVFSPRVLNEARFSFVRRNLQFPENDARDPSTTITGLFTIGGNSNFPQGRVQESYALTDSLSVLKGRHAFKVGFDIRRQTLDNIAAFDSKGTFTFDNLQDYMNNTASTFRQALQTASYFSTEWQQFYFAQDDFHVTPELTLNLGLRYELTTVPFGLFGATDPQSLAALVPGPTKQDTNDWTPTLGFAYSPKAERGVLGKLFGNGKTVFRGGYRKTFDRLFYNIEVVNGSNFPRVVVPQIQPAIDVYPNLLAVNGAAVFDPLAGYVNTPVDAENPEAKIFSASMQRELGRDFLVEIGYSGNRGSHGINQLQANYAVLTPDQAATVRTTLSASSIPSVQARRLFPQFGSRTLIATTATSSYNAGFITIDKRFSHGLQFKLSYTLSKWMSDNDESLGVGAITTGSPQIPQDFANIPAEYSLSAFDRTHRFVASYVYEIPWLQSNWAQGVLKQVFGGWQLSGITSFQSGQPFTIVTGVDSNGNGSGGDRPNFNPGGTFTLDPYLHNMRSFTTDNMFLVPRGSNGLPLANSLGNGNLGRNTLRAAGVWNTDLTILKRFHLGGPRQLVIRADLLNAFNQKNYGIPVNSLASPNFGQNLNDWGNRSITASAKFIF